MKSIKKIFGRFDRLPVKKKMQLVTAVTLSVCMLITIPSYAWFNEQKKAAEMFKVENPNALYVNAAHREDRVYFDLGEININGYEEDEWGNTIYYTDKTYLVEAKLRDSNGNLVLDEFGHPTYDKDHGFAKLITDKQYVFSVSGSNTDKFTLQMAHTNNNKFIYEVYDATQYRYRSEDDLPSTNPETGNAYTDAEKAKLVVPNNASFIKYTTSKNSHNEDQPQVEYDPYDDSAEPIDLFYVKGNQVQGGAYKNNDTNNLGKVYDTVPDQEHGVEGVFNKYYSATYDEYTKVHEQAVPSYWQAEVELDTNNGEIDANKNFCKYYILRVTWDNNEQTAQEKKETDMVYFSVKR